MFKAYVRKQEGLLILIIAVFVLGTVAGAVWVQVMPSYGRADLLDYLQSIIRALPNTSTPSITEVYLNGIDAMLRTAGLVWILGLTIVGAPLILFIIFLRGFILGFTVGFFIEQWVFRGVLLAIASVAPQSLFMIPAMFLVAAAALSFALDVVKGVAGLRFQGTPFVATAIASLVSCVLLFLGTAAESYLAPLFVALFQNWIL